MKGGALPVDDAVEIAAQVAEGLAKAHAQGVIHRDIKPGNLILTEDGVKILDFGLAKLAAESLRLTLEGTTIGTVAYMSPEQARGDEADPRSDVWALGIVLYEMLAGQPPFRGHYAEAISHAIRHDTPAPLRTPGRDVPEALERLAFHALKKNPDQRVQSARDFARELRLLQGRTLPLDLRTEPLTAPLLGAARALTARGTRFWTLPRTIGAAATVVALLAGAPLWLFAPVERIPVAVAPVVNQTGFGELEPYRLALTEELIARLADSGSVRVIPYDRLLQIMRPFRLDNRDLSSRGAMQAITMHSGARIIIAPTLLQENGAWKARVEFRNAETATNDLPPLETDAVVSSLPKDTAHRLVTILAAGIDERFVNTGPRRAYVADVLRKLTGGTSPPVPRLRNLDTAIAFEQGLDAYEQQEYAAALRAFASASQQDSRNPLVFAWRSRAARIMRHDDEATQAAGQAVALLTAGMSGAGRLFIESVAAESRRDSAVAESGFRELATQRPDDPAAAMELAAHLDRQGRTEDAIAAYLDTLTRDTRLATPHAELCRMYNRANEFVKAQEHAQLAISSYRTLGARSGEAQALLCLADALRTGIPEQRQQARVHAEAALKIFEELGLLYNVPRAYNYMAMIAGIQDSRAEAAALGEKALLSARSAGNEVLQPLVLMNLGVTHEALGNRARAADYYQQSIKLYEQFGDQARAAQIQANRAALLIKYGMNPEEGLRAAQNALGVSRTLGNKDFEAFCLQTIALYYEYAGRHVDAERQLSQIVAIARERDLTEKLASANIRRARSRVAIGDYLGARQLLTETVPAASDTTNRVEAAIQLGRVHARLGDFDTARADLNRAAIQLPAGDLGLVALLHTAMGELEYESGRLREARVQFKEAADLWSDAFPTAASVEARAYLGLLDAATGSLAEGRRAVQSSLDFARKSGQVPLEALSRMFLARIEIGAGRFGDAVKALAEIPADNEQRTIGPELRALVRYWRAEALMGRGDPGAASERRSARDVLAPVLASLPEAYRISFSNRPDIARIISDR